MHLPQHSGQFQELRSKPHQLTCNKDQLNWKGPKILHTDSNAETNLWFGKTTENYDGYLDIYDPSTNPAGAYRNPAPASSWTQAAKDANALLPIFPSLKNVVLGSMINFQFCLREYSLGIHNYKYTKALLQNSIEALTAAGI